MKSNYSKLHEKDYQLLYKKYEATRAENKELKKINDYLKKVAESTNEIKDMMK